MTIETTRRGFLKFLGIGAASAIIEEPVRKLWFVGSNAPVGSRIESVAYDFPVVSVNEHGHGAPCDSPGKPFLLPGEYMLPSNGRTWGWHADPDPGTDSVRIFNGSKQLVGRISAHDWDNDRAGALEDLGFRMSDGYKSDERVKDYERAVAKAAEMSKADDAVMQAFEIAQGEMRTQLQNAQRRAVERAGYSPWVTDPSQGGHLTRAELLRRVAEVYGPYGRPLAVHG